MPPRGVTVHIHYTYIAHLAVTERLSLDFMNTLDHPQRIMKYSLSLMFINANPCMKFRPHKRVEKNPSPSAGKDNSVTST